MLLWSGLLEVSKWSFFLVAQFTEVVDHIVNDMESEKLEIEAKSSSDRKKCSASVTKQGDGCNTNTSGNN